MSLLLDLPAETEAALQAKAARLGVPVERYAAGVLRRDVENGNGQAPAAQAPQSTLAARKLAALKAAIDQAREFSAAPGALHAPLSDWALSRAGAYDAE